MVYKFSTLVGLTSAVSFGCGVRNTMVHLIEYNYDVIEKWMTLLEQ